MFDIGIESYSFHRYFGELRAGELPVDQKISMIEFLDIVSSYNPTSIGLQTCFIDFKDVSFVKELSSLLIKRDYTLVISWGHPSGLELGKSNEAYKDLLNKLSWAQELNAEHFRIVIDSPKLWNVESSEETIKRIMPMINNIVSIASKNKINISVENHGGLKMKVYYEIIKSVDSSFFGMTFDIGNFIRTGERIEDALSLLGKYIKVVHIKDFALEGLKPGEPDGWWPTVSLGEGDLPLKDTLFSLNKLNFKGPVLVELMAPLNNDEPETETIEKSLSFLNAQQSLHQLEE
jgi:3-oxoisoapionate decarboxylase